MNEEKIESMLSQLIMMVGNSEADQLEMKQGLQEMKQDLQEVKRDVQEMKQDKKNMQEKLQELETKGAERHKEILKRFTAIETDQDYIWEKTARNEKRSPTLKDNYANHIKSPTIYFKVSILTKRILEKLGVRHDPGQGL